MNCIAMESSSYSGSFALVARFDTFYGPLQIYSPQALHAICSALPIVKHDDAQPQALLEGFTFQQWASYGRRKSRITSKVCKENGRLKAILESTNSNWDKRNKVKSAHDDEDPLIFNDPWSGCSLPHVTVASGPSCLSL